MLTNINPNGLSKQVGRNCDIKVKAFSGATSEDMKDYIKPIIKKKPDIMVMHIGTNDLTEENSKTIKNLEEILKLCEKESPQTEITLSTPIIRTDINNSNKKIRDLNNSFKKFCNTHKIRLLDNSNIESSHLGRKKLHLNIRGNTMFAKNLANHIKQN